MRAALSLALVLMAKSSRRWRFGWCEYIEVSRALVVHGKRSQLRGKPLDVLLQLLTNAETVVPKETLIELVWGNASQQSLTVAISKLRKAFGGDTNDIIQNVAAEGYRMAVPVHVTVVADPSEPVLVLNVGESVPRDMRWRAYVRLGGPDSGPVWLANHEDTQEQRVFKFATDGIRLRTLQREETVAGLLSRSGTQVASLRRVDDWNFSEHPYYLAGEYVGPNLLAFSETNEFRGMNRRDRVVLIAKLCDSVATAHALGVLHNDLKPSNVLVRQLPQSTQMAANNDISSSRYAMVLIDFGDSSLLDIRSSWDSFTEEQDDIFLSQGATSATTHSEMYRAPELRLGRSVSVEADIYSLGIVLYQAVVGDFAHVPAAGWQEYVKDSLLEMIIARAAHRDPHARFRTAASLAESLHSLEEAREAEQERERVRLSTLQIQRDLDRARAVRPWIVIALVILVAGMLISGWFYHSALKQRDLARRENQLSQAMLAFLSDDVLSQSNPGSGSPGSQHAVDLTLADAIGNAVKQIEVRFPRDPMIAARLHETIADGLRARTQFVEADQQYGIAAEEYRSVGGLLSQDAIAVDLKRDATRLSGQLPDAVVKARKDFNRQAGLIHQIQRPRPEVLALQDFVESGLIGLESDPAKAIPALERAIRTGESSSDFDPMLLLWIKGRLCGLYVRLQDGPKLEAAAEERIREISSRFGKDSPLLVSYEIYLQEAYFLEGRYKESIGQADRNYPRFQHLLGSQNQYTLAVLATRASSLAQLGRYREAVQDDMQLAKMEVGNPSGERIRIGSLNDAALFACRSGQFANGRQNATIALSEAGPGKNYMPGYYNGARFAMAECIVSEQEAAAHPDAGHLRVADALLNRVDASVIAQQTGDRGYDALVELARARIALLEHNIPAAGRDIEATDNFFRHPDSDPYELQQYRRVNEQIARGTSFFR
jgi:non-specific serine/threonine protein kinase